MTVVNKRVLKAVVVFFFLSCGLFFSEALFGQVNWVSPTGTSWLTGANWSGAAVPGLADMAQFGTYPTSATIGVGINMDTAGGSVSAGAIHLSSARSANLFIGNSATATPGTLNLFGATVAGVPNVVLANLGTSNARLTLQNTQGAGASTLRIGLDTGTNNIITGIGSTTSIGNTINITSVISGNGQIQLLGSGTWDATTSSGVNGGLLKLGANNTFTGGIAVGNSDGSSSGILELDSAAAISNTTGNDVTINANSQLYLAAPAGTTYPTSNVTLYLNGFGNNYSITGKGALVNLSGNSLAWDGAVNLPNSAGISVLGNTTVTLTLNGNINGAGQLVKYGGGNLLLRGTANSWTGGTMITAGKLTVDTSSSLSTGPLQMAQTSGNLVVVLNNASQTIGNLSSSFIGTSNNNTLTLNGTRLIINQDSNTVFGGSTATLSSAITGTGSVVKNGGGRLTFTSAGNNFSGGLKISRGEIRLNPSSLASMTLTGPDTLDGGTLSTAGLTRGFTFNFGTLALTDSSTIDLGSDTTHLIKFAASSSISWLAGRTLTVYHWMGSFNGGAGLRGRLFVGASAAGLTSSQLRQVKFIDSVGNIFAATLLSTGELVPAAPTITTTAATYGPFCNNVADSITVAFTTSGPFTGPFKVQLSSASGVFASDFTSNIIGSGTTSPINAIIPTGIAGGTAYRVRVINSSPVAVFGTNNGNNIPITGPTSLPSIVGPSVLAIGVATTFTNSIAGGTWASSNVSIATATTGGVVTGVTNGADTIIYNYTNSCGISSSTYRIINVVPIPAITGISPDHGIPASTVTISGNDFNTTPSYNLVFFGPVRATVLSGSATSLSVRVPVMAAYAPITVTDSLTGLTASSQVPYTPIYATTGLIPDSINFKPRHDIATGTLPIGVASGDLDGDGKPDLVVVNSGPNNIYIYLNQDTTGALTPASFASPVIVPTTFGPHYLKIADLDGDGLLDIVVTNTSSSANKLSVFRNISTRGTLTFAARVDISSGGSAPFDLAIADMDMDGKPDIAVVNQSSNKIALLRNLSSPGSLTVSSFATPVSFNTGFTPFKLFIGDLDGDNKPDLAVTNYTSNTVSIFHNATTIGSIGGSSLSSPTTLSTASSPTGITGADIDADGLTDVIVTNSGANSISIYRNTNSAAGVLSFASPINFAAGGVPEDVASGDIDGDSKQDIIVGNYTGNNVSVFRNMGVTGGVGSGSLAARADLPTSTYPAGLSIGDLDGDGKPDIAVVNGGASSFSILKNYPLPPNGVILGRDSICLGTSTTLTDSVAGGTWGSTNPSIATVNSAGVVTSIAPGLDTMFYYTVAQGDTNYAYHPLTIDRPTFAGPIASATGNTVCMGALLALTDTAGPGIWTSSNASVATVNASTGFVTGLTTGAATITYYVANTCGSSSDTFALTVAPSSGYVIGAISGARPVCVGSAITLSDTTAGGNWLSSDSTVTHISGSGVVTGIAAGTASISYGFTGSCGIYITTVSIVIDTPLVADSITGPSTLCEGATATYSDAAGSGGIWSLTNGRVSISGSTLTGIASGADTLIYTIANACGTDTGIRSITVLAAPDAGTISGSNIVCTGASTTLSSTSTGGTWSKTNTRANITAAGVVSGVTAGLDTIRYILSNGCGADTAQLVMQIITVPNPGIINGPTSVCVGGSITLSDTSGNGVWRSINGNATVADSVVTGVAPGTDTISYTLTNTCGSAFAIKRIAVIAYPVVDSITGPSTVCTGNSITLSDTTSGGIWTRSNARGNISATGVFTGLSAGLDTVTYTVGTTCKTAVTKVITITQRPSAGTITGLNTVCVGQSIVQRDTIAGGVWSSSNLYSTFTGDSLLTGVMAGTDTLTYTLTNECGLSIATKRITINPLPHAAPITGESKLYAGQIILLRDSTIGGLWTVVNSNALISVDGRLGGLVPGLDTVRYTVTNTCGKDTALFPVTIYPSDDPYGISDVVVYPNPGKGKFNFNISSELNQQVSVLIFDPLFRAMNLFTANTNVVNELDMGDAPDGVYLLSVISTKSWFTVKFVILK